MSQEPSPSAIAQEVVLVLTELGISLAKIVAVVFLLLGAIGVAFTITLFAGQALFDFLPSVPDVVDFVPDIVWAILQVILWLISLAFYLVLSWALWEHARERAAKKLTKEQSQ